MPRKPAKAAKEPNLELPSFGLRRRAKDPRPEETAEPDTPEPDTPEPDTPEPGAAEPEVPEPDTAERPVRPRRSRPSPLTAVPGSAAAALAGVVCGLLGIGLTSGSLHGCEAVRGVGTCGGIGVFALLAILVVEIFVGAALLRACRVPDPFSTSFLGVGVAAVLLVLFLLDHLGAWWMLGVVPLLTAAAYVFSWWVATRFVDVRDDDRHR
jgi:hypothetical protein